MQFPIVLDSQVHPSGTPTLPVPSGKLYVCNLMAAGGVDCKLPPPDAAAGSGLTPCVAVALAFPSPAGWVDGLGRDSNFIGSPLGASARQKTTHSRVPSSVTLMTDRPFTGLPPIFSEKKTQADFLSF